MRKTTAVVAGMLLATGATSHAFAEQATFEVPAECGNKPDFRAELSRLAGSDAARARPSLVRIEREPGGAYRLTLVLGSETRQLEHADCRVLLRSAAVIVAASVKVEAASAATSTSEPATASANPKHQTVTATPAAQDAGASTTTLVRPSEHGDALRGSAALGVGLAGGVVPGVAAAFEARGALVGGVFGASLGLRYLPNQLAEVQGRAAEIFGVGVRPAFVIVPAPVLAVSLGLDVDRLSGRGKSVARPARGSAWTLAPSAEVALIPLRTRNFSLELAAEGRLALLRPSFVVTGFQDLYRVPSFGTVLVLRGGWQFP